MVTRLLALYLPSRPQNVIDIGGGDARQAIQLARAGHNVTVVDIDDGMLVHAQRRLTAEPEQVARRVRLVHGEGAGAAHLVGTGFDLVCCHSVLAYQDDPRKMLHELVNLARVGGLISVLCINQESIAVRSALEGRWRDAAAALYSGTEAGASYLSARPHTRREITAILDRAGARVLDWQGVGIFTDHAGAKVSERDAAEVLQVEWIAGSRDPYRQIARSFHLIAEKSRNLRRLSLGQLPRAYAPGHRAADQGPG